MLCVSRVYSFVLDKEQFGTNGLLHKLEKVLQLIRS